MLSVLYIFLQDIHDGFSFSLSVWFMVIDSVIYGILVWYLDNVMPGELALLQDAYLDIVLL